MGISSTVFEINGDEVENQIFFTRIFNAPDHRVPLEFCNGGKAQKTRIMSLSEGSKS